MDSALENARNVLASAQEWSLSDNGWEDVAALVYRLAAAVAYRTMTAIRAATAELQLVSPLRVVTRIDDPPRRPIPTPIRDRINELIHEIDEMPQPRDEPATGDVPDRTR